MMISYFYRISEIRYICVRNGTLINHDSWVANFVAIFYFEPAC